MIKQVVIALAIGFFLTSLYMMVPKKDAAQPQTAAASTPNKPAVRSNAPAPSKEAPVKPTPPNIVINIDDTAVKRLIRCEQIRSGRLEDRDGANTARDWEKYCKFLQDMKD
jgi:hypothetical protein